MAVANTLAYYDTAAIMAVKSYIVQAQGVSVTRYIFQSSNLKIKR